MEKMTGKEAIVVEQWDRGLRPIPLRNSLERLQYDAQKIRPILEQRGLPHELNACGLLDRDAHAAALKLVPIAEATEWWE